MSKQPITTRLSSKGQLVVPKEIRQRLGWKPGLLLAVDDHDGSITLRPHPPLPETRLEDVVGCMAYEGPPLSVREMDEGIRRALARRRE